jgi:hypothetical protein
VQVKARGKTGFVEPAHLGTESLLELYFIDVGQGDGVLIRTPEDRHILIDGGWPRKSQPTGKNAADFVDWKFDKDYGTLTLKLDAMICSHNDQDHYGGLWDLLDKDQQEELKCTTIQIENFYHAGLSWWRGPTDRTLGPSQTTPQGEMWTQLLGDRAHLQQSLASSGSHPRLQGEWADFLRKVEQAKTSAGTPTPVTRLSHLTNKLPASVVGSKVSFVVLGPVEFAVGGKPAIRKFAGGPDKNTNGNSVLLRLDYDHVRILLTGDLNTASQQSLLGDYAGHHDVFACDVAKGCHHGSDNVSLSFLRAMQPACTILSSGDSEGHDHPRPNIIAACGLTGFVTEKDDKLVTPLVYSTELARSITLGQINQLEELDASNTVLQQHAGDALSQLRARYKFAMAGDRNPQEESTRLSSRRIAARTTYGLINVRTDGETILFAARNEKDSSWNVTTIKGRF